MTITVITIIKAPPFDILPDGREICHPTPDGAREYRRRTLEMRRRQGELCRWCGYWMHEDETTFDHDKLRGAGRQDDRIVIIVDGLEIRQNAAVHMLCNGERGSQKRLTRGEVTKSNDSNRQMSPIVTEVLTIPHKRTHSYCLPEG